MAMQNNMLLAATLTTLLSAVAPQALAASAADLTVGGTIQPGTCVASFDGGNEINLGVIQVDELNPVGEATVIFKKKTLTINCDAATSFYLAAPFDNGGQLKNHGAASNIATGQLEWTFQDGTPQTFTCLPSHLPENLPMSDNGDGVLRRAGTQYVRARPTRPPSLMPCADGHYYGAIFGTGDGFSDGMHATPILRADIDGTHFIKRTVIPVGLMATINPRETLETANDIELEGSAVLNIIYL